MPDIPHYERKLVYVAGPYQFPSPISNTRIAITTAERLEACGVITAYVPHMNLLWDLVHPHDAEFWYGYDLALLARCDALYRFPGESAGADNEIAFSNRHSIPVFRNEGACIAWAQHAFDN